MIKNYLLGLSFLHSTSSDSATPSLVFIKWLSCIVVPYPQVLSSSISVSDADVVDFSSPLLTILSSIISAKNYLPFKPHLIPLTFIKAIIRASKAFPAKVLFMSQSLHYCNCINFYLIRPSFRKSESTLMRVSQSISTLFKMTEWSTLPNFLMNFSTECFFL